MSEQYHQEYWSEVISEALCEIGKFDLVTSDEIVSLGKYLASSADTHQAFGYDVAGANLAGETQRKEDNLRKELRRERDKVTCRECRGLGRLNYNAGPWAVDTECDKCRGAGRHDP